MKSRKKAVEIEAVEWTGFNLKEIQDFVGDSLIVEYNDAAYQAGVAPPVVRLTIHTLEGDMICNRGDYIIKGIKGEFYPCKPDIFEQSYEQAS